MRRGPPSLPTPPSPPCGRAPANGPRALPAAAAALLLAGCIVVPRTAEVYDPQCRTLVRQVVLDTAVIGTIGHCHNDGCAVMLASMGIVTAASAVVSGSVAIIGNIVYWAERQGRCPVAPEPAAAPAPTAPAAASAASAASAALAALAALAASGPRPRPPVVPGLVPAPAPLGPPRTDPR